MDSMSATFDVANYLRRISYEGSIEPNAETLRKLHLAHMKSVPFENLDVYLKRPIVLNVDSLYEKIVTRNRGGFCYELNGLFAHLLRSLGFSVMLLSARVARKDGSFGPEFDHMTLLVELERRWIADVGFGESFVEPILLDSTAEQTQYGKRYRVIPSDDGLIYQAFESNDWSNQYRFEVVPRKFQEYGQMCIYHQTSPDSTFTQKVVCSRATKQGRITLTDKKFIVSSGSERTESIISGEQEFYSLLLEHFGIIL